MSRYTDNRSGAYIINRRAPRRKRRPARATGIIITALILLTAVICLLVYFLPYITAATTAGGNAVHGKTYYFLAFGKFETRDRADIQAKDTASRGGAGYVYNDGLYSVIAAVYDREADVKTLEQVNPDSHSFALTVDKFEGTENDGEAFSYFVGEWFTAVFTAASELERGNITEAAAEYAVERAASALRKMSRKADSTLLGKALENAGGYAHDGTRSVLSGIRCYQVRAVMSVLREL